MQRLDSPVMCFPFWLWAVSLSLWRNAFLYSGHTQFRFFVTHGLLFWCSVFRDTVSLTRHKMRCNWTPHQSASLISWAPVSGAQWCGLFWLWRSLHRLIVFFRKVHMICWWSVFLIIQLFRLSIMNFECHPSSFSQSSYCFNIHIKLPQLLKHTQKQKSCQCLQCFWPGFASCTLMWVLSQKNSIVVYRLSSKPIFSAL